MKKQPDFTELFYSCFGQVPRKVQYEVRQGASRYHDLVFPNSLIHDARFVRAKIRLRGRRLTIPINRDCWELKSTIHEREKDIYAELHIADAVLTISPIEDIQWTFRHTADFAGDKELWIQDLWIERNDHQDEITKIVINGFDWKCTLRAQCDDLQIKLKDSEVPYLYSEREEAQRERCT